MDSAIRDTIEREGIARLEHELLQTFAAEAASPAPLFILGSPRTGSTLIYQLCAERFGLPFIANLTNDLFPQAPILGLAIQKAVPVMVTRESRFGKTEGAFQPSEGSAVMANWFGGGHPSQVVSTETLEEKKGHFLATLVAAETLFGRPLMIKNAWNCFRIPALAGLLLKARFLWVRRDIVDASISDLEARYVTKGRPDTWNSATPASYEVLKYRPPVEQVVENQYAFNRAIGDDLALHAAGRWAGIWYEDLLVAPDKAMGDVGAMLGMAPRGGRLRLSARTEGRRLSAEESASIGAYVAANAARMASFRRTKAP